MSSRKRQDVWKNNERHYCAVCNAWMGSDRQSILLHENGKKHKENQEKALKQMRLDKLKQEKDQKLLQNSLMQMEQAAQSHMQQDALSNPAALAAMLYPAPVSSTPVHAPPPPPPTSARTAPVPPQSAQHQKEEWQAKRKSRQNNNDDKETSDLDPVVTQPSQAKVKIERGMGSYEIGSQTFLEGEIFSAILDDEMPVQLWTGPPNATTMEMRLPDRQALWKNAILATKRQTTAHVSYLASDDAEEETLEKGVPFCRIRILLGGDDEAIPDTLEEAVLMANGGEEVTVQPEAGEGNQDVAVEEATGLTGWSTVAIKRTTVRQEVKEERARIREKKRQAAAEAESKEKEAESRRMEEAKVANADDSALGAYDVWGKGGYKGVDISANTDSGLTVTDLAKKPITGGKVSVAFKKQKKRRLNNSRRTTSADDDD
eukprot:Nitzschia sp. Nitz4//scaffold22_size323478//290636//291928//NITZ4_000587-RA/size323478-processed-gene-0.488-mRNA-1//-1//CDS//3329543177//319//frame0